MRIRPHLHRGHVWIPLLLLVLIHWVAERPSMADPAKVARASHVYMRSGPGTEFTPEDVLRAGEPVETLETTGEWTKIRTRKGQVGYVHRAYLEQVDEESGAGGEARAESAPEAAAEPPAEEPSASGSGAGEPAAASSGTTGPGGVEALKEELVGLRKEVEGLRRQVRRGLPTPAGATARGEEEDDAISIPTSGVLLDRSDEGSVGQPGVRVVAVGLVSLAVGWILGATLSRRRSRSQRSKLRF